jgi:transcriptional regulator with XRE-family HTH domain
MSKSDPLINRLRQYRLEHQLTQQELARKLGVAFITMNRWLNGHATPQELQQYRIEKLLKTQKRRRSPTNG